MGLVAVGAHSKVYFRQIMSPCAQIFSEIYQAARFSLFKTKTLSPIITTFNLCKLLPLFPLSLPHQRFPRERSNTKK